jgi:hypothetical protein
MMIEMVMEMFFSSFNYSNIYLSRVFLSIYNISFTINCFIKLVVILYYLINKLINFHNYKQYKSINHLFNFKFSFEII